MGRANPKGLSKALPREMLGVLVVGRMLDVGRANPKGLSKALPRETLRVLVVGRAIDMRRANSKRLNRGGFLLVEITGGKGCNLMLHYFVPVGKIEGV